MILCVFRKTPGHILLTTYVLKAAPASDYICRTKNNVSIEIFDVLGNLVKAGTFNNSQKYISIPVENLSKGLYSVRIKSQNVLDVKKFIKD